MGKKSKKARVGGGAEGDAAATATPAAAVTDKGEAEVAATGGKRKSDIDDIFGAIAGSGGKKSKTTPTANATPPTGSKGETIKEKEKPKSRKPGKVEGSVDDIFGVEAAEVRKRTEEGYVIYHEDELRMNKGGGTDLCPFDCTCCY
mmetsp:Transcript_37257/g.66693  ORF Transcript_37257/g.66693 Transcript_37257/m.66693 type:complete len:146 (-) Transcript_37257:154-591(-)